MSGNGERDPDTGRLTTWGYTERAVKLAQWLIVPLVLWAISVQIFISKGPRFTNADAYNLKHELRSEWREDLTELIKTGELPRAAIRLTNLEQDVEEIKRDIREVANTVNENRSTLSAIRTLLDSDR